MTTSTAPFLSHLSDWPQYIAASTSSASATYPVNATSSGDGVEDRQQPDNNNSGSAGGGADDEDYNFFNHELSSNETGPTAHHSDADQTDIGDEIHLVCPLNLKLNLILI